MLLRSCTCSSLSRRFVADAVSRRYDPTGTTGVRRRYENEMVRRFRRISALIREAVVKLDVLGLRDPGGVIPHMMTAISSRAAVSDASPPPGKAFQFARSGDKVASFMEWLREAQREEILNVAFGTSMSRAADASWQNVYIDTAYQKGIRDASKSAGKGLELIGSFNSPVHADRVGLIYTRTFESLKGVTEAMSSQMSRVLAQGIAEGRGPMSIARDLTERVEKIGVARGRVIARTETIAAHAEGMLNTFEEAGVSGVEVEAEFATARDEKVCPECEELEGQVYTLKEARGMIPVHPNCRCTFIPVVT